MPMKYGVLSYERKALSLNGRDGQNLGDWIQTIAAEEFYKEIGIEDYLLVSRNDAAMYEGAEVRLVVNGYHTLINRVGYKTNTFPLSSKIIPVFLSMHFHDRNIPEEMKHQLISFGPVGCRDEETVLNMRRNGIPAFLSGCATALFSRRSVNPDKQKEVLLIDIPDGIEEKMPDEIRKQAKYMTQIFPIKRQTGELYMTAEESAEAYKKARELLEYYRENAALVVTSRLHAAVPCMAMGIPVILVKEDFDGRFSWLEKYLPLYSKDKWDEIQWNALPVDYESDKVEMKECWKRFILLNDDKGQKNGLPDDFWGNRVCYEYNKNIKKAFRDIAKNCKENEQYSLWGVTDNTLRTNNVIRDLLPNWKLVNVYDLIVDGKFEGVSIQKPEEITLENNQIYFVIAPKAWNAAKRKLECLGHRYVLLDVNNGSWEAKFS